MMWHMQRGCAKNIFFSLYVFGKPAIHFSSFSPLLPLTEVSPQPSAIPSGNPPGDWQSTVGWGDTGFKLRTAGQQSGVLPFLSHHSSQKEGACTGVGSDLNIPGMGVHKT
jgi:hypothetical protein